MSDLRAKTARWAVAAALLLGAVRAVAAEPVRWQDRTPPGAGEVVAVAPHPSDPAAAAVADRAGLVFVTRDGGRTWRVVREPGSGTGLPGREELLLDLEVRAIELHAGATLGNPGAAAPWVAGELLTEDEAHPGFLYRERPGALSGPVRIGWDGDRPVVALAEGWVALPSGAPARAPAPRADGAPVPDVPPPAARAAIAGDGAQGTWAWTPEGVWRLEVVPAHAGSRADRLPVEAVIGAALDRAGLRVATLRGRRMVAAWMPAVVAEVATGTALATRWSGLGTVGDRGVETWVGVRAVWAGRPGRASARDLSVVDADGRPVPLVGLDDHVAASYLDRSATRYNLQVQARVRALAVERARWVARREAAAPLPDRVEAALAVAEIDALLDALSDGAATRAVRSSLD